MSAALGIQDFELLQLLGSGSSGSVWRAKKKATQQEFAIKIIDKHHIDPTIVARVLEERDIMTMLKNPFVTALHFAFQDDTRIFFVIDFKRGGDFSRMLKKIPDKTMPEPAARFYAAELLLALEYLHRNNICFRDLKSEHILVSEGGHLSVTDFGLAFRTNLDDSAHSCFCGTPEYMAPEVLCEEEYGMTIDYWAFGVILYEMVVGHSPWEGLMVEDLFFSVLTKPVPFPDSISPQYKSLVTALMNKDPVQRLGARGGAAEVRTHPFFDGVNWACVARRAIPPPYLPVKVDRLPKSMGELWQGFKPYCSLATQQDADAAVVKASL